MKIIQLNSVLLQGDAIGNIMKMIHKINQKQGWESSIAVDLFSDFISKDINVLASKDYNQTNLFYLLSRFYQIDGKLFYLKKYFRAKKQYKKGMARNKIENADIRVWHFGVWYPLLERFHPHDILVYQGLTFPYLTRTPKSILTSYTKLLTLRSLSPFIIVASQFMENDLLHQRFDQDQIKILPLPHKYYLPHIRHLHYQPRLLAYGRYARNKKIPELTKFCSEAGINLTTFGDNNQLKEFKLEYARAIHYQNDKIKILPKQRQIESFFGRNNVYISNSAHEGFNLPLIEAEAHSLPVLARRGSAMDELIIEGYNGYLFDELDEVPNLIEKIMHNYERMSYNAWIHSHNYTLSTYQAKYIKILKNYKKK